jgi:hypothetical protein
MLGREVGVTANAAVMGSETMRIHVMVLMLLYNAVLQVLLGCCTTNLRKHSLHRNTLRRVRAAPRRGSPPMPARRKTRPVADDYATRAQTLVCTRTIPCAPQSQSMPPSPASLVPTEQHTAETSAQDRARALSQRRSVRGGAPPAPP